MNVIYTTSATSTGGRDGHVKSEDGIIDMDLRSPAQMGGTGGATTPEQLFAAGWSACFNGALNLIARTRRIRIGESRITIHVSLNKTDDEMFQLSAKIDALIPGVPEETARELMEQAHNFCPFSRATRGNIEVETNLVSE